TAGINAMNLANENYFTVSKTFDVHTINLVSGVSFQSSKNEFFRAEARDFKNEVLGYNSLQGASQFLNSSSVDELFMASFLARANYSFSDRYLATLSFRRDGTSRFINQKWGNFYSGALAWNIKNEAFLKDNALISTLKLRTSIGQVGNASVPIQGALLDQTYSNYTFNGQIANGVSPSNLENRNLTWETTQQQNTGLDFGLFNDNLNFTVDYYVTKTKDLLLLTPVTISTGFSQGWFNIGEIQNSGLEFSIDYSLKTKSDFVWNTKLNFTTTKNEIKALGSNGEPIYIDVNYDAICTDEVILKVGGSINDLYGYQTEGIYKPEDFNADGTPKTGVATAGAGEKAGDIKYKDLNSDGKIDGFDRTVIGNTTAKIFGSWSNNFAYKGFDFDFVFQYSYGNDVFNASKTRISSFASGTSNQTTDWLNRWTPENSGSTQYAGVPSLRPADYLVEDGSFIRLQSVSFGYNLPSSWTSKAKMKSVKVYFTANNLALFTKYSGYDPEVTSNQVDHRYSFVQGFDYGGFPRAKTYMMGVKIQF
ncbi:MAG TPA: TonB-dependent receptor, partial [Bacteroidales bacterium]|nr:TonB-dependent receptor [Bacteroidales bacterium]